MHDLRRTSLSPIEPADKRASRAIAHSIIRPRENKVSRLGTGRETGTVYSRHRAQVRLANAISGPGTAQPVCKIVREPSSFGSARSILLPGRTRKKGMMRKRFVLRNNDVIIQLHAFSLVMPDYAAIIKLVEFQDLFKKHYNMFIICSLFLIICDISYILQFKSAHIFLFVFDRNIIIYITHNLQYTVIRYYNGIKFTQRLPGSFFLEITSI